MSNKKRGIMLKSLDYENEGMQELINPVPLDFIDQDHADDEMDFGVEDLMAEEDEAVKDVIELLQDTANLLKSDKKI